MTGNGGDWLLSMRVGILPGEIHQKDFWKQMKEARMRTVGIQTKVPILLMLASFKVSDNGSVK